MLLDTICFGVYVLASIFIASGMFKPQGANKVITHSLAILAIGLHAILLNSNVLVDAGENMSILNVASLIGLLGSITMFVASFKLPNTILLPVVYGFSGFIVLTNGLMPGAHIMHIGVQPFLIVHVSLALFAYACLGIAFLYAIQLAYINFRLKEKNASLLHSSLPPLMSVENILFKLLLVGTILLTLSLISGFVFLENMFAKEQAHKTVLSLLSWLIYSAILFGHAKFGWRGKPVITSTIIGSVLLTLAYFGSRFVREVILS